MKRLLFAAVLIAFPQLAAAACTLTYTTTFYFLGEERFITSNTWKALEPADVVAVNKLGQTVLDEASKWQDKAKRNEKHDIKFARLTVCEGTPATPEEAVQVEGLDWQGIDKVQKQSARIENQLTKMGSDHVAKGNKTGWGKQTK